MSFKKYFVAAACAVAATSAAHATTVTECLTKISGLRYTTDGVQTYTSSKDESGLMGKLDNASDKLNQAKFADSIQKMMDYYNQVSSMETAAKPKISFADGEMLKAGSLDTINCVRQIGQ